VGFEVIRVIVQREGYYTEKDGEDVYVESPREYVNYVVDHYRGSPQDDMNKAERISHLIFGALRGLDHGVTFCKRILGTPLVEHDWMVTQPIDRDIYIFKCKCCGTQFAVDGACMARIK